MRSPRNIKILLAYERSGSMYNSFKQLGFNVTSCDLSPAQSPGHNHIQAPVLSLDLGTYNFVMAFPPCTYLCKAQLWKCVPGTERYELQKKAIGEVKSLLSAGCQRLAIENPAGCLPRHIGKYSQMVFPWYFGDPYSKEICLWLRGMPKIVSTNYSPGRKSISNHVNGRMSQFEKSIIRSSWRYYPHMCDAIALQWGSFLCNQN